MWNWQVMKDEFQACLDCVQKGSKGHSKGQTHPFYQPSDSHSSDAPAFYLSRRRHGKDGRGHREHKHCPDGGIGYGRNTGTAEKQVFADFPNIQFKESVENPSEAILQKEVRFVLEVENDFADLLARGEPYTLTIHFDQSDTKAAGSMGILNQAIQSYSRQLVQQRLTDLNIDPQILEPVKVVQVNAAEENKGGNLMLMMMLPLIISILIAVEESRQPPIW